MSGWTTCGLLWTPSMRQMLCSSVSLKAGRSRLLFAAAHPERTAGLILAGAEVKERISDDWPWGEDTQTEFDRSMKALPERWGKGAFIDHVAPGLADDPHVRDWAGRLQITLPRQGPRSHSCEWHSTSTFDRSSPASEYRL